MLESGQLAAWIDEGRLAGIASIEFDRDDPAGLSPICVREVRPLAQAGMPAAEILERLIVTRARAIADLLLPLYDRTSGTAGFVSFDLRPLPTEGAGMILEAARRLWELVNRPNVLMRVPGSPEAAGLLEAATADGLNLHLHAVGALDRYADLADAYVRGLEARQARGQSVDHLASFITLDLGALDAAVTRQLELLAGGDAQAAPRARQLAGRAGRAFARLAVAQSWAVRSSAAFRRLAERSARPQLPLLAGLRVGVKAESFTRAGGIPDGAGYLIALEAEELGALADGGRLERLPESDLAAPRAELDALEDLGVSWAQVSRDLERRARDGGQRGHRGQLRAAARMAARAEHELGDLLPRVRESLTLLEAEDVVRRIWARDVSLWSSGGPGAAEAHRRLGWLTLPDDMLAALDGMRLLATGAREDGLAGAVLLGMGGSSLAADVLSRTLGGESPAMNLTVLDSTDPAAVLRATRRHAVQKTLFLVSSKSGTTTEPLALMEHFWARALDKAGEAAGRHFVALTDPGTPLERLARERGFRAVLSTPEDVGGRYSALSEFGLFPAALLGSDVPALLHGGARMMRACGPESAGIDNPGLFLGALLGVAALAGRDKVTLVSDPPLAAFGDWVEQLLAESSGKEGKGIVPIVDEPPAAGRLYGADRLLIYLRTRGTLDAKVANCTKAGVPVVVLEVPGDAAGIGAEFYRWEFATAVACHCLGVNAFDQPDVQRAKTRTSDLLKAYARSGSLPESQPLWRSEVLTLRGGPADPILQSARGLPELLEGILTQVTPQECLALLLYLPPGSALVRPLGAVRRRLREAGIVTTVGFGPRYLHSTGQLHKGGPDKMVFLIVTADPAEDVPVPRAAYSFGVLERAQALGDLQALLHLGRRAYNLHLSSPSGVGAVLWSLAVARAHRPEAG